MLHKSHQVAIVLCISAELKAMQRFLGTRVPTLIMSLFEQQRLLSKCGYVLNFPTCVHLELKVLCKKKRSVKSDKPSLQTRLVLQERSPASTKVFCELIKLPPKSLSNFRTFHNLDLTCYYKYSFFPDQHRETTSK